MRLSRDVTGVAFLAVVDGVPHAGLAVGLVTATPLLAPDSAGASLLFMAHRNGLALLSSWDALPLDGAPVAGWQVGAAPGAGLTVLAPDRTRLVHDLPVDTPPDWHATVVARGGLILVVTHVLPSDVDLIGYIAAEAGQGFVCAGPVRWGTTAPHRPARVDAPIERLMDLAWHVQEGILTLEAAKARARALTGGPLDALLHDEQQGWLYWRLVTELVDARGEPGAWRVAARRTVERAVPVVADRCDRAVFEEADEVAQRLLGHLRAAGGPVELEAALLAAARLRIATRGPELRGGDRAAPGVPTVWEARATAELYRHWFTDTEPFQRESAALVTEAAGLLAEAAQLEGGRQLPRLLALYAQLARDDDLARAAWSALPDPAADPDVALFLIRTLPELGTADAEACIGAVGQGINLARERGDRRLLRLALEHADRRGGRLAAAHRRQLDEARLHVLPDDPIDCPAAGADLAELAELAEHLPPDGHASRLHLAAHARDSGQPVLGLTLLRGTPDGGAREVRLLTADLHQQAAELGTPGPGPLPFPWGYHTYAALGYASLGQPDLARASLVPFVQQLQQLHGQELRQALYAVIVDVPAFDLSLAPELAELLRDLTHTAVWQLVVNSERLPLGLMLGLHHAVKGPQLGAWARIERPLRLTGFVQHFTGDLDGNGGLRRYVSSLVDRELEWHSARLVDDRQLWARVNELLDDRTVLLTWFLPMFVRGAAVLLSVTRQGTELHVRLGEDDGDGGDGGGGDADADRHPVQDEVEAIRAEILRDPLFGDVTPAGARLLELGNGLLGRSGGWTAWREQGKDRLLLWPHGALHLLPVALGRVDGRTVADDWTVTTIAGLESLAPAQHSEQRSARPRRTAVLASAAGGVPFGMHLEPALEDHARDVAAAAGGEAVVGPDATRARLLAELGTADVVHIAVHGALDRDGPWLHCLYLSPDPDDDGRVFAYDLLEVDLRGVRLVTLAACESALGRFDSADTVRGLPSALITAGAEAVVGCLWPVRPAPATFFYRHLHDGIGRGTAPVEAFRAAQLATRAAFPQYRDWGTFVYLHGRGQGAAQ